MAFWRFGNSAGRNSISRCASIVGRRSFLPVEWLRYAPDCNLCPPTQKDGDASSAAMQIQVRHHFSLPKDLVILNLFCIAGSSSDAISCRGQGQARHYGNRWQDRAGCRPALPGCCYIAVPYIGGPESLHGRGDTGNGPGSISYHSLGQ
jgi:hypothetical protein